MKTTMLLIFSMLFSVMELDANSDKFLFCYKFRPGVDLVYETQRQDSISFGAPTAPVSKHIRILLRQTLSAHEPGLNVHHALTYHVDSIDVTPGWTSPLFADWDLFRNTPAQTSDSLIQMSTNGYPVSDDPHFRLTQLTLPLSEYPLEPNEGWEFEFEVRENPSTQYEGSSIVFGHGMLYDFIRYDNRVVARFVVNTTQLFDGECHYSDDSSSVSFDRKGEISATHLVYFDEERGIIIKIVTDQVTKEQRYTASGYVAMTIKSKSTTELVSAHIP
ncbi:hypothetical protein JW948_15200 [bacterium]|nr:hypothetical protein [bacterium]